MDVLVYGSGRPESLGKMSARALEGLGHEVAFFDRSYPHRTVHRIADRVPGAGPALERLRRGAFRTQVAAVDPDLLLVVKGYELDGALVETAKSRSDAVAVNWNPDNPFQHRSEPTRAETYLDALSSYDTVCIWDEFLVAELRSEGARDVEVLPFAHDPALHHRTEPVPRYDCEVSFVGYWSMKRERVLGHLTEFDLQVWGPGWREQCDAPALEPAICGGRLEGVEYARAMSSADVVVNVVADHNVPGHNRRTFEAPASGSLTVTTRTPGQATFFTEGEDVAMYDDGRELRETVARYLDADDRREAVAASGYETVQPHTYRARMETLLDAVDV